MTEDSPVRTGPDPFLPFATDRFAASESDDHPGGGGVFNPWRCRRCDAYSTMHVGERGTNELHQRGRDLWSGIFKVSGMVAVSNDDPTTVLSAQMGNKRSCHLRLDARIPLSLYQQGRNSNGFGANIQKFRVTAHIDSRRIR